MRRFGRIPNTITRLPRIDAAFDVFCVGPPPMVGAIRATLPRKGLDPGYLYSDSFERASDARPA